MDRKTSRTEILKTPVELIQIFLNQKCSMKNRSILKKYAAILAFAVSAIVFLPETLHAQGAVIGYVWGGNSVSDAQLDRLTHIMVVDLYVSTTGTLLPNPGFNMSITNWINNWLTPLVNRAHAKDVKVSIVIGHGTGYHNFPSATSSTYLTNFVEQIATLED